MTKHLFLTSRTILHKLLTCCNGVEICHCSFCVISYSRITLSCLIGRKGELDLSMSYFLLRHQEYFAVIEIATPTSPIMVLNFFCFTCKKKKIPSNITVGDGTHISEKWFPALCWWSGVSTVKVCFYSLPVLDLKRNCCNSLVQFHAFIFAGCVGG